MASPALRPYAPGDETGIRLLFSQVHKRELSPETWCWRYRLNPAGESVVTVAVEDGEVVGHVGVLPMLVSGHAAGLWVDLMIRQDRRNLDLFLDMAQASLEATERAGMEFVYAFPNDKSHPVLKRMLGWRTLREIDALEAPLRMLEAPTPALKAEPFSAAGPEFDAFWESVRPKNALCAVRDAAWIRWRYLERPGAPYACLKALSPSGGLAGWAALKVFDSGQGVIGDILDLWAPEPPASDALWGATLTHFRSKGVTTVSSWAPGLPGLSPGGPRTHFAAHPRFCYDAGDWRVSKGDSDVF